MYSKTIKTIIFLFSSFLLAACNGFFDKDTTPRPTPLTTFTPEVAPQRLWSTQAGPGFYKEYLKVGVAIGPRALFTTSGKGIVTAVAKNNGAIIWQMCTRVPLSTTAGVGEGVVVVGSRKGDVVALEEGTGQILWQTQLPGEILATPIVSHNMVIIKTTDGYVRALSIASGQERWSFQQVEPSLILRGASDPVVQDRNLIVGYANGNLGKYTLRDGQMLWLTPVTTAEGAFAVQRMIDIDATPIVYQHQIYAATYQGKIAKLDWLTGRRRWTHDLSSYTGMIADQNTVFISDASSYIWAFSAEGGDVLWRQTNLANRRITGPAIQGPYIVVGDAAGYLHWLDKNDGHFAARVKQGSTFYAAPVTENGVLYAFSSTGKLAAYTLANC